MVCTKLFPFPRGCAVQLPPRGQHLPAQYCSILGHSLSKPFQKEKKKKGGTAAIVRRIFMQLKKNSSGKCAERLHPYVEYIDVVSRK